MAVIEFSTLGTIDLRGPDGHALHSLLAQPKRIALLAYLCAAQPRGFHRRDKLLGLFWPDADQAHARTSLRNALHTLRHSLGEAAIQSRGDEEVCISSSAVSCDAVSLEERVASGDVNGALDLYRGDFLAGFFLEDVSAFERWLESERARVRAIAARAARVAGERYEAERNLTAAVTLARRAVELTDADERSVRRLVELLARVGDRAGALQAYDKFERQLASEFEAEPSAETRALVDRLRGQQRPAARIDRHSGGPAVTTIAAGMSLPGYVVEHELGRGGMATVYLARDLKHDRPVAIKFLRPDIAALLGANRFLAEIALAARLHHPNVLPLLDSGETNGLPYYIMPLADGETLRNRLRRERFLPLDDAIRIAREVGDALGYAHARGIIHRDIKPENILLENGHAVVADFGIARAISQAGGERLTETGLALGTAAYMSPEQADGAIELDARTDLYALACVLYEMLTGDPPFPGTTAQAVLARKAAEPAPPMRTVRETIPLSMERAVLKALSRAPADRFTTVEEFTHALTSRPANWLLRIPDLRRMVGQRPVAASAVMGVLALITAVSIARTTNSGNRPHPEARQKLTAVGNAMMASLSPDRQFLVYVTQAGDSQRVMVQDMSGGAANALITLPGAVYSLEWSADGSRVLVGGFPRAILLQRLGGPPITTGPIIDGQPMVYSLPDSARFSIHDVGDRRILVFDHRSQDTLALPVNGNYTFLREGSWSPTGSLFAVVVETGDPLGWELRAIGLDGRTETVLTDTVVLGSPRWSRDGNRLYYGRGTEAVWAIDVSPRTGRPRGVPHQVVNNLEMLSQRFGRVHFALTPDREGLLFARGARFANLWLLERSGPSTVPRVTALTTGTSLRWSPVVSPDGSTIAFAQANGDTAELFTMPVTGGPPVQITFGARVRAESQIAWSPDGTRIAFGSVRRGRAQVWVAAASDGRLRSYAQTRMSTATGHLAWAPGTAIAYQTTDHLKINLIDPISGQERTLAHDTALGAFHAPTYSPDGARLGVFWFRPGKPYEIFVFDVRRSSFVRIGEGVHPRGWSSDGRYLYFQWPQSPIIYRLDSRGGSKAEIFLKPPFRQAQCKPVGSARPNAFICAVSDFVSDIWRIDNFDQRQD